MIYWQYNTLWIWILLFRMKLFKMNWKAIKVFGSNWTNYTNIIIRLSYSQFYFCNQFIVCKLSHYQCMRIVVEGKNRECTIRKRFKWWNFIVNIKWVAVKTEKQKIFKHETYEIFVSETNSWVELWVWFSFSSIYSGQDCNVINIFLNIHIVCYWI